MSYAYPINDDYTVSPADHGKVLVLGNTSLTDSSGAYRISFYPSEDFAGSFGVVSRPAGDVASNRGTGFLAVPYRRIYVNGAASDYQLATDTLSGAWDIIVPANQFAIGLVVACTAGTGYLYKRAVTRGADVAASTLTLGTANNVAGKFGVDSFSTMVSFTRPANGTAYTAGDVMADTATSATCTSLVIPVAAYAGQRVRIDKLWLSTSQAACVAQVRTHWFGLPRLSLPTPTPVDNLAMTTILANDPYFKGFYDLQPLTAEAGSNTAAHTPFSVPVFECSCQPTETNLYCTLTTNSGFTPDSAQTFTLFVSGVRF